MKLTAEQKEMIETWFEFCTASPDFNCLLEAENGSCDKCKALKEALTK